VLARGRGHTASMDGRTVAARLADEYLSGGAAQRRLFGGARHGKARSTAHALVELVPAVNSAVSGPGRYTSYTVVTAICELGTLRRNTRCCVWTSPDCISIRV